MASEDAAATKRDLAQLAERFENRLVRVQSELGERLAHVQSELQEQMRDMQTELLKAFLPWQDQVRIQFRELEANTGNSVQAVKERMNILERRLAEIEKRLLLNPPAA